MVVRALRGAAAAWLALAALAAQAGPPDCARPNAWPASIEALHLRNAGAFDASPLDLTKTTVARVASERLARDRYRQVHRVKMFTAAGTPVVAITVNEASSRECSLTGVDVYVVSGVLGDYAESK